MYYRAFKLTVLTFTCLLALNLPLLKAQIFTAPLQASTTGTNPVDFEFRADGTLISKGNFGVGSLLSTDQGNGTRLLWFPSLGAFRAGTITTGLTLGSNPWDSANIGSYSAAFGFDTTASGEYAGAFGYGTYATNVASFVAGSGNYAGGYASTAFGIGTYAAADISTSIGAYTTVYGRNAFAAGGLTTASGTDSFAVGDTTTASGYASVAAGYLTSAAASLDFVIGTNNIGGGDPLNWVATDPLFEIGNGSTGTTSDALVVYKSGNAKLSGTLQVAPGGDIPMYTGN